MNLGTLFRWLYFSALAVFALVAAPDAGAQSDPANFMTVINVPDDPAPNSIGSDTQLNLAEGGRLAHHFVAGSPEGADSNIEVNVSGGVVETTFQAYGDVRVNVSGGDFGPQFFAGDGTRVTISGGSFDHGFTVLPGSTVHILGAVVGRLGTASGDCEVRITGGAIGDGFSVYAGADVEISGGTVADYLTAQSGGVINISSGVIGDELRVNSGSVVNISGGVVGDDMDLEIGSRVNITGGTVGNNLQVSHHDIEVAISGGAFGDEIDARYEAIVLKGKDFRLNGAPIAGLNAVGSTFAADTTTGGLFSGLLADGVPFALYRADGDGGRFVFEVVDAPDPTPGAIVLPGAAAPLGVASGQSLIVGVGGVLGDHFNAGAGGSLLIDGGVVGGNLEILDARVTLASGSIGNDADVLPRRQSDDHRRFNRLSVEGVRRLTY